ncbi:MAG: hypothetical protein C4575_01855 [Desulforudis sp.]|jgi:hypothetical protein|nr:MAG: hypothetical protein C4575_01855 [Desulforudis sp.]
MAVETGEKLELIDVIRSLGKPLTRSGVGLPAFVPGKLDAENYRSSPSGVELFGWKLDLKATTNQGLVIRNVVYEDAYYIYKMLVPVYVI